MATWIPWIIAFIFPRIPTDYCIYIPVNKSEFSLSHHTRRLVMWSQRLILWCYELIIRNNQPPPLPISGAYHIQIQTILHDSNYHGSVPPDLGELRLSQKWYKPIWHAIWNAKPFRGWKTISGDVDCPRFRGPRICIGLFLLHFDVTANAFCHSRVGVRAGGSRRTERREGGEPPHPK